MIECGENHREWDKRCRIRYLLDHWQDIFDPSVTSTWATFTGVSGGVAASRAPSPLPQMAHHPTVKRIERAMIALADREPVLVRHLKAYRCNAEWRCLDTFALVRLPSGKHDLVERRVREKIVPRWVDPKKVQLAENLLVSFVHGPVDIPTPLWLALEKP